MAVTNVSENSQKLTFDAHQEVSVDSRVIGLDGSDDLAFQNLTGRWWWCGKAPWTPTTTDGLVESTGFLAAKPNLLYQCVVSPMMWRHMVTNHATSRNAWQMNPAGYLANTFRYWRGGITFRIHVVASKFHQGRIKIQFDPFDGDASNDEVESRYTWILDLNEAHEIDVTIPYAAFRSYLNVQEATNKALQDPEYSNTTTSSTQATFDENKHMGFFSITKVNDLVAPNGSSGVVYLSIWQKCDDDIEFQVPNTGWHNMIIQATGASEVISAIGASDETDESDDHPGTTSNEMTMWKSYEAPSRTLVWFGERVMSIRSLLKRTMYIETIGTANADPNGVYMFDYNITHWPDIPQSNWKKKNNYLSYFAPAFLAKRGSTRFKLYHVGLPGNGNVMRDSNTAIHVERRWSQTHITNQRLSYSLAGSGGADVYTEKVATGATGGLVAGKGLGDRLIEVESPYYMNQRFQLGTWIDNASLSTIDNGTNYLRCTLTVDYRQLENPALSVMQSGGEDCSLMFFLAAPVLYDI